MDLVDFSQEVYETIRQEFTIFSTRLRIKHISFIPMSGLLGDNVVEPSTRMPWYQGEPLLSFLEDVHIASDWNLQDSRFPVQWVVRPQDGAHRDFRAYAGQIASWGSSLGAAFRQIIQDQGHCADGSIDEDCSCAHVGFFAS